MVQRITAPEPRTGGPGDVEPLAALAAEAAQMQDDEAAQAAQASEQRERAEQQHAQAEAASEAAFLAKILSKGRDTVAAVLDHTDTLPREQTMAIWSDATVEGIAEAVVGLPGEHMEWLSQLLAKYGPYMALAMAVGPPAYVTYAAMGEHRKKREAVDVQATEVPPGGQQ